MTISDRIRLLRRLPWVAWKFWRALNAWERRDWPRMVSLLRAVVSGGDAVDEHYVLLGVALANQRLYSEAITYFTLVNPNELIFQEEKASYANNYAFTLMQMGEHVQAKELLRQFSRERWPEPQRRWADQVLALSGQTEPPPVNRLKRPCVWRLSKSPDSTGGQNGDGV